MSATISEAEPFAEFKNDPQPFLDRLRTTNEPTSIRESMDDIEAGRVYPADEVLDELARKHKLAGSQRA